MCPVEKTLFVEVLFELTILYIQLKLSILTVIYMCFIYVLSLLSSASRRPSVSRSIIGCTAQ